MHLLRTGFISLLAASALSACDSRPIINTDTRPFTIGGFGLDSTKSQLKDAGRLGTCSQKNERISECRFEPEKERFTFMGGEVNQITYVFLDDSPSVVGVKLTAIGDIVSEFDLRLKWGLKPEGCINSYDELKLAEYSSIANQDIRFARSQGLLGSKYTCLVEGGRAVAGSFTESGKKYESTVEFRYLSTSAQQTLEPIFRLNRELQARNASLNK